MSASVLYMSVSLDGYIADPNDKLGGDDGNRLPYWGLTPDGEGFRSDGVAGQLLDEYNATGAVVVGRRLPRLWITGAVIITAAASRSSCPAIGHLVPRSPTIRW
jgi:hypothetical protein